MSPSETRLSNDASPEAILSYYKDALGAHGSVTECRGDIDFKRSGLVCRKRLFSRTTQLAVGTKKSTAWYR